MQSVELRRRVQVGLNKGEAKNSLARAVFLNRLGEVSDRSFENQRYRASGLNLVVVSIVLWAIPGTGNSGDRGQAIPGTGQAIPTGNSGDSILNSLRRKAEGRIDLVPGHEEPALFILFHQPQPL